MEQDHRYIRRLLELRGEPRVPVLWLLIPWILALAWGIRVARLGALEDPALHGFWGAFAGMEILGQFALCCLFCGGGFLATWAWLYHAWPEHPRVLCWATALLLLGMPVLPAYVVFILPVLVSLAMCGAIIEQWTADRRLLRRPESAPPAV